MLPLGILYILLFDHLLHTIYTSSSLKLYILLLRLDRDRGGTAGSDHYHHKECLGVGW
jgi:hypothetical protein